MLFELGYEVRDCYWEHRQEGTGLHVQDLYARMITVLGCMGETTSEYARTLAVAYLAWTPLHSKLPAYCYVEEALEASLSRLAEEVSNSHQGVNARSLSAMYMSACRPSDEVHDKMKSHVGATFIGDTATRLKDMLELCTDRTLAWVPPVLSTSSTNAHRTHPSMVWPDRPALPQTLLRPGGVNFEYILCAALRQFMRPLTAQSQPDTYCVLVETKVCEGLQPRSITQRQRRERVAVAVDTAVSNLIQANPDLRPKKKAKAKAKMAPVAVPVVAPPKPKPKRIPKPRGPRPPAKLVRASPNLALASSSSQLLPLAQVLPVQPAAEDRDDSSSRGSEVPQHTDFLFAPVTVSRPSESSSSSSSSSTSSTSSTSTVSSTSSDSGSDLTSNEPAAN